MTPRWIRRIACAGIFWAACLWAAPGSAQPADTISPPRPAQEEDALAVPGQYIILFKAEVVPGDREGKIRRNGGEVRHNYKNVPAAAARFANDRAVAELSADPDILEIIPDRVVRASAKPDKDAGGPTSSALSTQMIPAGVARIGASPGALGYSGSGVGVAVVDTGLDYAHPDLAPVSPDCFTAYVFCQDDDGHGTHVGGTIGARDNNQDVVGVAPTAVLYSVKVLNQNGSGSDSDVMAGFDWIAQNAVRVVPPIRAVNVSLGRPGTLNDNIALRASVQAVTNLGISVVVAAGNDPKKEVKDMIPATYPEVLSIASSTAADGSNSCRWFKGKISADTASYFTTDGKYDTATGIGVTISAPGETKENISKSCFIQSIGIQSTRLGGGTTSLSGTSMAAPHATGVIALAWEKALSLGLSLSPETARTILRSGADLAAIAPLNSPSGSYSFDGEREGILWAPDALSAVGAP